MSNDKTTQELASFEYYHWLLPILENVDSGQSIKAVSCMFKTEWDDSPEEMRFIKGNLDAAKKGAIVERIFVMNKDELALALANEAIQKHTKEHRKLTKLRGFFADKSKIDIKLMTYIGHGFTIFNSRFALVDRFDVNGNVRGVITMKLHEIRKMEEAFDQLKNISQELSLYLK